MTALLRSGQVAQAAGVNQQTLRYYERRGLLDEPSAPTVDIVCTPAKAVTALRVIKTAQRLGFTLDEVADLLTGGHHHGRVVDPSLQAQARRKIEEVDQRIHDLEIIKANLQAAVDAGCDDITLCATTDCCPIPFAELTTDERSGNA